MRALPPDLLPVCIRFKLSKDRLFSLPAQAVRDFKTILNYEMELANRAK